MRLLALALLCALGLPAHAEQPFKLPQDDATAAFVESNIRATFYHELGHALIDVLQLPVLGREEDAADTLSSVLIHQIWDEDSATAIIYDTAEAFRLYDAEAEGDETAYWGEHSLDLQRYYNLVCLFYGADPEVREDVAKQLELPADRAEGCADEFDLAKTSWLGMLDGLEPTAESKGLKMVGVAADDDLGIILADEVKDLNLIYGLPAEITVTVADCGEANAFYQPADKSITICTEYAQNLARLWTGQN